VKYDEKEVTIKRSSEVTLAKTKYLVNNVAQDVDWHEKLIHFSADWQVRLTLRIQLQHNINLTNRHQTLFMLITNGGSVLVANQQIKRHEMKKVILVGTNHQIQRGEKLKGCFEKYILNLAIKHEIKGVAEEINEDAELIVAKKICQKLSISHKIIEPNPKEYDELNIEHVHKINYEFCNYYYLESPPNDINSSPQVLKKYESRIQETYRARENEWLKRILSLNTWPILVICGSNHFKPFSELLFQNKINVTFGESSWGV
jgi:hypothetical protein